MKKKFVLVVLLFLTMLFIGCNNDEPKEFHVRIEDGGVIVNDYVIDLNGKLEIEELTKEGYTFVGIYKDSSFKEEWNIDDLVTGDITLYIKWEKNKYEVIIDGNKQEVEYGASLKLDTPKKEGYTNVIKLRITLKILAKKDYV